MKLLSEIFLTGRRFALFITLICAYLILPGSPTVFAQENKKDIIPKKFTRGQMDQLNDPAELNNLGMLYLQRGEFERAKEYLSKAVELYPEEYLTHYNLGTFYGYINDMQNAIRHLNMAVELNPKSDRSFSALGSFYLRENKLPDAERSFLSALNINPQNTNALFGLMSVYQNENRIQEALETGKKLLAVDNKYQQLHLALSNLYFMKNDLTNALANAEVEQSFYPDEPESYYMLVLIYNKTGEQKKYLEALNKMNELLKRANSSQPLLNKK